METNSKAFFWYVERGAYTVGAVEESDDETRTLTPSVFANMRHAARTWPLRRYAPLQEHTGLFRVFADMGSTNDDIRRFADRFGMLTSAESAPVVDESARRQTVVHRLIFQHEPLDLWLDEAAAMRKAIAVWELLQKGDPSLLAPHVLWRNDSAGPCSVTFDTHPELPALAFSPRPDIRLKAAVAARGDEWIERLNPSDPVLPTRLWLEKLVNQKVQDALTAHFVLNKAGKMSLSATPHDLLQALWFQFGRAVCENKTYRRCSVCQDWFEVSPGVARTNRRFCGVSCKNRAYRERREQAGSLHASGKTIREIAQELGAPEAVVKRWVKTGKKS